MDEVVTVSEIDSAWLTARLREAGALRQSRVTGFATQNVGNGLVGTSVRFSLQYDAAEPGAPASVVGKFPSDDPTSRQSGAGMRLYLREVNFYRHIAPTVKIHTPHVYASGFDPGSHDFFLLFEDMAPARGGDQLTGCDVADAATAMVEIAALHGPRWGDPALDALDWLGLPQPETERIVQLVAPVAEMFRERYQAVLEPEVMAAVMRLVPLAHRMMFDVAPARTVVHGDFRLDNLLFDAKGGALKLATLDWQTVGRGCGTLDAAYFLGAGLRSWDRAAHEADLMRLYHDALLSFGVAGYVWEQCWHDYRKYCLHGVFMAMFSAISVARTDRGDEMFLTMARRHAQQALELGAFDLWG
jgi:Phosphotransferase enzyme family